MNYLDLAQLITQGQIFEAIQQIRMLISDANSSITTKLDELSHTYEQSVIYHLKGIEDLERTKILRWLREQLLNIAVEINYQRMRHTSHALYYSYQSEIVSLSDEVDYLLSFDTKHDNTLAIERLFKHIWTTQQLSADDRLALLRLSDPYEQCLVISAITLALDYYPTRSHLLYLIEALHQWGHAPQVRARIIVALVLVNRYSWGSILIDSLSTELDELFSLDENLPNDLSHATLQICRAYGTSEISRELQQTLHRKWSAISPEVRHRLTSIDINEGSSYELYDVLKQSGLEETMHTASNMLSDGDDIFFDQFAQLKKHPYYQRLSVWFTPLSVRNSLYQKLMSKHPDIAQHIQSLRHTLCDSDIYSLLLIADTMNASAQLGGWHIELPPKPRGEASDFETYLKHYIADLYRFCKLYTYKSEHTDYFDYEHSTAPINALTKRYTTSESLLEQLAVLYLKQKRTLQANELYQQLSLIDPTQARYYDRQGEIFMLEGQWSEAVQAFTRANLIDERPARNLRLAQCQYELGEYHLAIKLLRETDFGSLPLERAEALIKIAASYIALGQWSEALEVGFEFEITHQESKRSRRIIAFSLLNLGRTQEAEGIYKAICTDNPSPSDWLNMGHTALKLNQRREAIACYQEALNLLGKEQFTLYWQEERSMLMRLNISDELVNSIQEYMLYLNNRSINDI